MRTKSISIISGAILATVSASALAFVFSTDGDSDGGGGGTYGGYGGGGGVAVTWPTREIIGQRELVTDWKLWTGGNVGDIFDASQSFRDRSADSYGVSLPTQQEKDEAAKKAREVCRAGCATDQATENAVCEATAAQMRTATFAGGSAVWGAKRIPIARAWLRKFGGEAIDPAWVIAAGIGGANEYAAACKGYAAGRYATCMTTGSCKG
jgi:hypothetical protein